MKFKRLAVLATSGVAVSLALTACGGSGFSENTPAAGGSSAAGGESAAVKELAKVFNQQGGEWVDTAIGGSGNVR